MSPANPNPRAFVIGHPIRHSRSPLMHGYWLRHLGLHGVYDAVDVAPEALGAFIAGSSDQGYAGGNVTLPHKQAILPLLQRIEPAARAIGAVNTVWREPDGLVGDNTDAHGFLANLDEQAPGWDVASGLAVVLGAGGAARAIVFALLQRGMGVHIANRTRASADALVAAFGGSAGGQASLAPHLEHARLLVNTTSLGMAGAASLDLDLAPLHRDAVVCDIVYVPLQTALLARAQARGHRTVDGLGMLMHQAAPGFARWFGNMPAVTAELRALMTADIVNPSR